MHNLVFVADEVAQNVVRTEPWEIKRESLQLSNKFLADYFYDECTGILNNVTKVTIKTPRNGEMFRIEFLQEAKAVRKLRHKNLVQVCRTLFKCTIIFGKGVIFEAIREISFPSQLLRSLKLCCNSSRMLRLHFRFR